MSLCRSGVSSEVRPQVGQFAVVGQVPGHPAGDPGSDRKRPVFFRFGLERDEAGPPVEFGFASRLADLDQLCGGLSGPNLQRLCADALPKEALEGFVRWFVPGDGALGRDDLRPVLGDERECEQTLVLARELGGPGFSRQRLGPFEGGDDVDVAFAHRHGAQGLQTRLETVLGRIALGDGAALSAH